MKSIRDIYKEIGIKNLYTSGNYINPHIDRVNKLLTDFKNYNNIKNKNILDLSCGHGEVSLLFQDNNIIGNDPYTYEYYNHITKNKCMKYSFEDIAYKNINIGTYDYIICSYALHLCENSALELLLYNLSLSSKHLVIISPSDVINNKINNVMGWKLLYSNKYNRTHLFYYHNEL